MQHANRSSIFDNSDSHGSAIINKNNSIGAIGASTSSGMVPFAQNSIVLMLFSSLHLALWQLCKLFNMSSTYNKMKKKLQGKELKRKSSSSLVTTGTVGADCHCRQSSKHFQCCYAVPQNSRKPPQNHQQQQQQQQQQIILKQQICIYNLHWVLNKIAVALIFFYHKIES